jgi:hypothetical protein
LLYPAEYLSKTEFMPPSSRQRTCPCRLNLDTKSVSTQEDISGGERDAFVAIAEAVAVCERLHQSRGFLFDRAVIAGLRSKNRSLNPAFIADTVRTAEELDESVLHPVDFGTREVIRDLLREALQQVAVACDRLLEGIHHFRTNQVLGGNHIVKVETKRLFEYVAVGLPILFGHGNELIVKLGVDFPSELLGCRVRHSSNLLP